MPTLRMRGAGTEEGHGGEVFSCVYTADGAFVLSAGWDGHLRLWMTSDGSAVSALLASAKPLSCCTLTPDGGAWVSGSMDGVLSWWDPLSHNLKQTFVGHIRPISAIQFAPDGKMLATASWDRKLMLRAIGTEREGHSLNGHHDIVAGCRWMPDGNQLLSWSHDGTLRLWDAETDVELSRLNGHEDRVTALAVTADGRWAISGGRDGTVKVWDMPSRIEVRSVQTNSEIRGCWCLLDGELAATVGADGFLVVWSLPELEVQAELSSNLRPLCGDLSPAGNEIVLGSENGHLHFIAIDGVEEIPMLVRPTQLLQPKAGVLGRFLGKPSRRPAYQYTCPACHHTAETPHLPSESVPCPTCKRLLRVSSQVRQLQPQ